MKKIAASLLLALFVSSGVNAQTLEKGDHTINLGFGFDPYFHFSKHHLATNHKKSAVGPIVLGYDYILTEKLGIGRISVGGILGQSFYTERYSTPAQDYKYNRNRTAIIARGTYHFDIPKAKGLDLYAGVGAGIYIHSSTERITHFNGMESKSKSGNVGAAHYVFAGVRYFFTDAFGVYVEAGHGLNAFNGGLSFKF